jgi:hypothetical protein
VDPEGSQSPIESTSAHPIIEPGYTLGTVTDKISSIVLGRGTSKGWIFGFAIAFSLLMLLNFTVGYLLVKGVGIWGINIPIGWGFAIVNFVWWIGIGHAGTLISAILLLLRQQWRTSINRFAEAMTLFAVACAGMFPLLHMGRPWLFYWLTPYPNPMWLWPQFRSPLVWDVFAVSTYATRIAALLVRGIGSGPGHAARPRQKPPRENYLRHAGDGLARLRRALVPLRDCIHPAGGTRNTPGGFRAHGSELRFLRGASSRLAHHDFPALFRRGRDLFRLRDGDDSGDSHPQVLQPGRFHHHAPPGQYG